MPPARSRTVARNSAAILARPRKRIALVARLHGVAHDAVDQTEELVELFVGGELARLLGDQGRFGLLLQQLLDAFLDSPRRTEDRHALSELDPHGVIHRQNSCEA